MSLINRGDKVEAVNKKKKKVVCQQPIKLKEEEEEDAEKNKTVFKYMCFM